MPTSYHVIVWCWREPWCRYKGRRKIFASIDPDIVLLALLLPLHMLILTLYNDVVCLATILRNSRKSWTFFSSTICNIVVLKHVRPLSLGHQPNSYKLMLLRFRGTLVGGVYWTIQGSPTFLELRATRGWWLMRRATSLMYTSELCHHNKVSDIHLCENNVYVNAIFRTGPRRAAWRPRAYSPWFCSIRKTTFGM